MLSLYFAVFVFCVVRLPGAKGGRSREDRGLWGSSAPRARWQPEARAIRLDTDSARGRKAWIEAWRKELGDSVHALPLLVINTHFPHHDLDRTFANISAGAYGLHFQRSDKLLLMVVGYLAVVHLHPVKRFTVFF